MHSLRKYSPPSSAEVKIGWNCTSSTPHAFTVCIGTTFIFIQQGSRLGLTMLQCGYFRIPLHLTLRICLFVRCVFYNAVLTVDFFLAWRCNELCTQNWIGDWRKWTSYDTISSIRLCLNRYKASADVRTGILNTTFVRAFPVLALRSALHRVVLCGLIGPVLCFIELEG
jgi:hypothetical protein